jgi:hypothetical protein
MFKEFKQVFMFLSFLSLSLYACTSIKSFFT